MDKENFLRSALENLAQSYIDSFFEADARSKQASGIGSVIQRRQLWNCCEWCARLAGSYPYAPGKYPEDIFRRHENCRCLVTVKTDKSGYTDVWSKKEYESQREARIAREQEIVDDDYEKRIRIARDSGEEYIDATDHWNRKPKKSGGSVKDAPTVFEYKGEKYVQDGNHIFIKDSEEERRVADWFADRYGAKITRIPEIKLPNDIHTPDYEINGMFYELKSPIKDGKRTIKKRILSAKEQAEGVIVNISKCPLSQQEVFSQIDGMLKGEDTEWLKRIIVISGELEANGEIKESTIRILRVIEKI
jgi:hypothetical protein